MTNPFRVRDYRLLWFGLTTSALGDGVFAAAVPLSLLRAGGGATDVGLIYSAQGIALAALVLGGGFWADRVRRTRLMIVADIVRGVAAVGFAVGVGVVPLGWLLPLAALMGAGEALFRPAYGALLPTVLPADSLQRANSVNTLSFRAAAIVGPALGGLLVVEYGAATAFLVNAATFAVSAAVEALVRERAAPVPAGDTPMIREALGGLTAIRARPWIGAVIGTAGAHMLLFIPVSFVLLPVVTTERFGASAYALLLSAQALGAVAGALIAMRWTPRRAGVVALSGVLPIAGILLCLVLPAPFGWLLAANVVTGAGIALFGILWDSALQRQVHPQVLGRVVALDYLGSYGLEPLGLALVGPAVALFGRDPVLWFAAILLPLTIYAPLLVPGVATFGGGPHSARRASDFPDLDLDSRGEHRHRRATDFDQAVER